MRIVRETWPRLITVGGAIAALVVLVITLSPVLHGETSSWSSLPVLAAFALGVGCLLHLGGGANAGRLGTILIIVALVLFAVIVVEVAIVLANWGTETLVPTSLP